MKNIKRTLLVVILLIPFAIKAETYDDAVEIANKYMQNSTYRNTYTRYLITNTSNYYKDATESFVNGGLLSYKEFGITQKGKGEGYSYLYDGIKYWTYTKNGSNRYIVSDKKDENRNKDDDTIKTKVTEFIKDDAKVVGTGTRNNPWVFVPTYQITISSSDHGKIGIMKNNTCESISYTDNLVISYKNDEVKLCLKPDNGYVYVDNTCSTFMDYSNDIIKINKIVRDLNCEIQFGKQTNEITLDQTGVDTKSVPEMIYTIYSDGWYKDKAGSTKITMLDKTPTKAGYEFEGYYTESNGEGIQVIDKTGKIIINETTSNLFTNSGRLYAKWKLVKFTLTFDKQSGSGGTSSIVATFDQGLTSVTVPSRAGYIFKGYYTQTNGSGTKYYDENGNGVRNWDIENNTTLYAYWYACPAGTYALAGAKSCTSCPKGTYQSSTGSTSCYSCPTCKTTASVGATSSSACTWNYGDGSRNTIQGGYVNHLRVNCYTGSYRADNISLEAYDGRYSRWGNYKTEDYVSNTNHGSCTYPIYSNYGFHRYWLVQGDLPLSMRQADTYCNIGPLSRNGNVVAEYGKIYKDYRTYTFSSPARGEKTVFLFLRALGGGGRPSLSQLSFNVTTSSGSNIGSFTLQQMVNNKYIKPLVIIDGVGVTNGLNLYNGGATSSSGWPIHIVMFMLEPNYGVSGFNLRSNINFIADGTYDSRWCPDHNMTCSTSSWQQTGTCYSGNCNDGWYYRYTDINNWRMTTY